MIKECPNCNNSMVEVKRGLDEGRIIYLYPKELGQKYKDRHYHEYRFYCDSCQKEWTYDSLFQSFEEVPEDSQFYYDKKKEILI